MRAHSDSLTRTYAYACVKIRRFSVAHRACQIARTKSKQALCVPSFASHANAYAHAHEHENAHAHEHAQRLKRIAQVEKPSQKQKDLIAIAFIASVCGGSMVRSASAASCTLFVSSQHIRCFVHLVFLVVEPCVSFSLFSYLHLIPSLH